MVRTDKGGRPKIGTLVSMTLPDEFVVELDRISGNFGISRAEAARKIIETGLDTFHIYEKIGVLKFAEIIKKSREANEAVTGNRQLTIFELLR